MLEPHAFVDAIGRKRLRPSPAPRFWAKVQIGNPEECWEFTGARTGGYGVFRVGGGSKGWNVVAHRFAYITTHGPLPPSVELDHLCRNKACCNPRHLEAVSHSENAARYWAALGRGATAPTCANGHVRTEATTYHHPTRNIVRCRPCRALGMRKRYRNATH